jgi:hypothetical protein
MLSSFRENVWITADCVHEREGGLHAVLLWSQVLIAKKRCSLLAEAKECTSKENSLTQGH